MVASAVYNKVLALYRKKCIEGGQNFVQLYGWNLEKKFQKYFSVFLAGGDATRRGGDLLVRRIDQTFAKAKK